MMIAAVLAVTPPLINNYGLEDERRSLRAGLPAAGAPVAILHAPEPRPHAPAVQLLAPFFDPHPQAKPEAAQAQAEQLHEAEVPACKAWCVKQKDTTWADKCLSGGCSGCVECALYCEDSCALKTMLTWGERCSALRECTGCTEVRPLAPPHRTFSLAPRWPCPPPALTLSPPSLKHA